MNAFDFETKAIEARPNYPPEPVGLAISGIYCGWGHPSGNNAKSVDAVDRLEARWQGELLCHNAAFDLEVAMVHFGLPLPEGRQINDTMFLAFLLDPYGELGLKPLAHRYLGMPPEERDAVHAWLVEHKVVRKNLKRWGAHISAAPGDVVGPYAIGDVTRTEQLYEKLSKEVKARGMWEAYRRECGIMPMLLDNSMRGVPLALARLKKDTQRFEDILAATEKHLKSAWKSEIGSTPPGNWGASDELRDQLVRGGIRLPLTPTGKASTSKTSLEEALPDGKVKALLLYRSAIEKSLSTYMRPWLAQGGVLHCSWNQVRSYEDEGARTGRLSSSPNFQNITNPERYEQLGAKMRAWGCKFPWIEFPNLRGYIEVPRGWTMFGIDYSQQELRMLAHFEDDVLAQGFRDDPKMDVHEYVRGLIKSVTGMDIPRKHVKNINFAKIYGAGIAKLAQQMEVDYDTGAQLVRAYENALPSVRELQKEINATGRSGQHITTIGGRHYFAEPASIVNDELRSYEYKLLNYLVQGSSADQTKEAMRLWWEQHLRRENRARFLLTVHDELIGMAPTKIVKQEAKKAQTCMIEAVKLDVPVVAEIKYGKSYGELK